MIENVKGTVGIHCLVSPGFWVCNSLDIWRSVSCRLFLGSDLIPGSTPTKEQPKSTASGSSGESMDSVSVSSCESNHSEAEEGSTTPMDTPDEPQKKVMLRFPRILIPVTAPSVLLLT